MPGKLQKYGEDYKNLCVLLTPEEHRAYRIRALEMGITVADVVRVALEDERNWKAAAKARAAALKSKHAAQ